MIDINAIEAGAVVRLMSGGPNMTVTGFAIQAGQRGPTKRIGVKLLLWNDRQGFVRIELPPELLTLPRPRPVIPPVAGEGEES